MKAQLSLGLVVGLVLLLVVLMSLHDWTLNGEIKPEVLEQAPMITSQGINGRAFDEQGQLKYSLTAESAVDFDYTQQLQLTQPQVEIYNGDSRWLVTAENGSMSGRDQGKRELVLKNQVQAHLLGAQTADISADELRYFPATQELVSPGKIVIRQQQNITRAGRMQANLQTGQLRLSQGVESEYAVPAF